MRCVLDYEADKTFAEQSVKAWSIMQSLTEEPSYREDDIKDPRDRAYFYGYKAAVDESICSLTNILFDGDDNDIDLIEEFKDWCASNICMLLFSILDEQSEIEVIDT